MAFALCGAALAPAAAAPPPAALARVQQVKVRAVLDGAGLSHVFARGRALIVLDPNQGLVRRYVLGEDDLVGALTACSMRRDFSPRHVQPYATGVRVLGEEPQPGAVPTNARLPVLDLTDALLSGMEPYADGQAGRPADCGPVVERATSVPSSARASGRVWLVGASPGLAAPSRGALRVGPDAGAELFNVRAVGRLGGIGPAVLRRELVGGESGSVSVAVWLTLLRDGRPSSVRLYEHRLNEKGEVTGLIKRGFDYAAVAGHSLFVVGTTCPDAFCIDRYDMADLPPGTGVGNNWVASIDLSRGPGREFPEDGPIDAGPAQPEVVEGTDVSPGLVAWQARLTRAVGNYAFVAWSYPARARSMPCRNAVPDSCAVRLHDGSLIDAGIAVTGDGRVTQKGDAGDAVWIGPRHLIEAGLSTQPALSQRGVPYSYGGNDGPDEFVQALTAAAPRPVGHIREHLVGVAGSRYPLGIDCSRLVGAVLGPLLETKDWIAAPPPLSEARPVRDIRYARPGDVIVKKGHIVIFSRRVMSGPNRAIEVFEASSRCGRVCRSVYDVDFFNGWRIMRTRQMKGGGPTPMDNPYWKDGAAGT